MKRLTPFPLEVVGETVIKTGYRGFACAVNLLTGAGEERIPIVIFARTREEAAAVCEYLADSHMELELVKPAILGGDSKP